MTNWRRKLDADDRAATVVVLSVNDVYDLHPDEHGRGGLAEFATLLERERAAVPADATLLVTLNGDFLSGSEIGERCQGYVHPSVCSSSVLVM
jgi:2',3'-cyclic-nucleotide 2'-phosphodiesterase (5'-nucleotidase family)